MRLISLRTASAVASSAWSVSGDCTCSGFCGFVRVWADPPSCAPGESWAVTEPACHRQPKVKKKSTARQSNHLIDLIDLIGPRTRPLSGLRFPLLQPSRSGLRRTPASEPGSLLSYTAREQVG